jgi:hypothetical protein
VVVACPSDGGNRREGTPLSLGLRLPLLVAIGAFSLFGCGDSSTAPALEVFIEGPIQGDLLAGDQVQLQVTLSDPSAKGTVSWTSSDTSVALVSSSGYLRAQRPGSTTVSVKFNKAKSDAVVRVVPRPGGYTAPEIDYFQQIAFGFEYGSASEIIRKWGANPRIQILGVPTAEDLGVLESVVSELNLLMEGAQVELVDSDPTVEVHFGPISTFPTILPSYVSGNWGYFSVWFDGGGRISRAVVLLASDVANQEQRNHLIREEVTQMLGLAKDSNRYSGSIFYAPWTTTQSYDPIDEALIEMLYRPQLLTGLEYRGAVDRLRTMTRRGWEGPSTSSSLTPDFLSDPDPWTARRKGKGGVGSGGGMTTTRLRDPSL